MIDSFALIVAHSLLLVGLWRLTQRDDLDREQDTDKAPRQADRAPRA